MNGLRELLATRRDEILSRVERDLRERLSVEEPVLRALLGTLPRTLDTLQAELDARLPGHAPPLAAPPAGALSPQGLGAAVLTRAYGLLREGLLGLLEESGGALRFSELRVIHRFLDQALEAAMEERRRTAEFRERFLSIVSHDLRNPLNAIALSAGVLLREELPVRARKAAGRISQSAERMARMIGDLQDFTRGRLGGGIPILRQQVDLLLICRPVLEELRVAWPDRELRLRVEGDLQGEWDADRLAQLVGNLVKNALDYSPPDQPVTVTLRDEGAWVRLEVHNLGEPISPQLLPQLFEPFRRGMRREEGSQSPGLGLGLFIAHQITLAHEGMLEARSTQEDGTTFILRLPRAALPR